MQLVSGLLIISILFVLMLIMLEFGRRMALRRSDTELEKMRAGAMSIEGAVFGLMGLLVAFTFYGAASRFDARRWLVVEETNKIGTAWLRLDLLPEEARESLREKFRQYVEVRISMYKKLPDYGAALADYQKAGPMQSQIWGEAVAASKGADSTRMLLLPALNDMIDMTSTRAMAAQLHPPTLIYAMLWVLVLTSALLAGYGMGGKRRDWIHSLSFLVVMALTIYVVLDFEFPHMGLIQIHSAEQVLIDFRQGMGT